MPDSFSDQCCPCLASQLTEQIHVRSLDRVHDEIRSTRTEFAHTIYSGSGLQRVIPYILLLLVIHGEGIPHAEDYNGVWDIYRELDLRLDDE